MKLLPLQLVRLVVGLLGMFFAYALGRMWMRTRRNGLPFTKILTWVLRTIVAVFAVLYTGGADRLGIVLLALMALAIAAGVFMEIRPRHVEETHLFREPQ